MIERIGHINIRTADNTFEDTLRFYEDLMGLNRLTSMATPSPDNVWLYAESGRPIIHVNAVKDGEEFSAYAPPTGRLNHVAFDCRDYDLAVYRMQRMNLSFNRYETQVPGLVLLVTKDPINNIVIELSFGADTVLRSDLHASPKADAAPSRTSKTEAAGRVVIHPSEIPPPPVPYSPGILAGNVLYVAGVLSLAEDMRTTFGIGDIKMQTKKVIETIRTIVMEAGGQLSDVTFNTIFLRSLDDYTGMNEVYAQYFNDSPPARLCVRADLVPPDCLVEIASVAHISRDRQGSS